MQQAYHVNEVRTGQNSESIINNGYKPLRTLKQFSKEEKSAAINKEAENLRTTNTFVSITDEELSNVPKSRILNSFTTVIVKPDDTLKARCVGRGDLQSITDR